MTETAKKVLEKALELPPIDRAALVEKLLSSFELPERQSLDALWAAEAEDRINAYEQGLIPSIPSSAIFSRFFKF